MFDGLAICAIIGNGFNPTIDVAEIDVQSLQDGLNEVVKWIYKECTSSSSDIVQPMSDQQHIHASKFLLCYGVPYAKICDGFIPFSRDFFTAHIDKNRVTFNCTETMENAFIEDLYNRFMNPKEDFLASITAMLESSNFQIALHEFTETIHVDNGHICYEVNNDLQKMITEIGKQQWEVPSTLPVDWKFERFSLEDFKKCWIALFSCCFIFILAKIKCRLPGLSEEDGIIIMPKNTFIDYLCDMTNVKKETAEAIMDILIFDPKKRNADIMYQPVIELGDQILITPFLVVSGVPERNLIAVIQKKNDKVYSYESNDLESMMRTNIKSSLPPETITCENVELGKEYPDIDFGIYDESSNSIFISELKWLIAADSSKEVFSRMEDIDHGCEQIEKIMAIALMDRSAFAKRLFSIEVDNPDIICCVIAKHNVRSSNLYIPVIAEEQFLELIGKYSLGTVFQMIRNKEYTARIPEKAEMGHLAVHYAGYEFLLPALIIDKYCMGCYP